MQSVFERLGLYNTKEIKKKRPFKKQRLRFKAVLREGRDRTPDRVFEYARENRREQTYSERKFRRILRICGLSGKFKAQEALYGFILDFYCARLQMGIEIDGSSHEGKEEYDRRRENIFNLNGIRIVRFSNDQIKNEARKVIKTLYKEMKVSNKVMRLKNRKDRPRATTGKVFFANEYSQDKLMAMIPK
jgi:very-short-patch-repair endonuclease